MNDLDLGTVAESGLASLLVAQGNLDRDAYDGPTLWGYIRHDNSSKPGCMIRPSVRPCFRENAKRSGLQNSRERIYLAASLH